MAARWILNRCCHIEPLVNSDSPNRTRFEGREQGVGHTYYLLCSYVHDRTAMYSGITGMQRVKPLRAPCGLRGIISSG
jgi:hypothetical protein